MVSMRFFVVWLVCIWGMAQSCQTLSSRKEEVPAGQLEIARQFVSSGQHKKALGLLQSLNKSHPKVAGVQFLFGLAFLGLGDVKAAKVRFSQALLFEPRHGDAKLNLAYAHIVLNEFEVARGHLRALKSWNTYSYPEKVELNLGLSWMEQGQCPRANPHFEKALTLDPTFVSAYFNLGKCLRSLGKLSESQSRLERAVQFCPGCSEPLFELVSVLLERGRREQAHQVVKDLSRMSLTPRDRRRLGFWKMRINGGKKQ